MRCVDPFVKAGEAFACGRCLPCLFKKRREWFTRILLEGSQHAESSVVTLTYREEEVPKGGELCPEHLRNWLKRIRKRVYKEQGGRLLRFYACGEYGEKLGRPHFHVVLFGYGGCRAGRGSRQWCGDCSCVNCSGVAATWSLGASSIDILTPQSASYVAGYVTRKLLGTTLPDKLSPFTRMSNRPGIGASAMWDVASTLLTYGLEKRPLPYVLISGKSKRLALGRYLRGMLAKYLDEEVSNEKSAAVQNVLDFAWDRSLSIKSVFRELNEVYASQLAQAEKLKENAL